MFTSVRETRARTFYLFVALLLEVISWIVGSPTDRCCLQDAVRPSHRKLCSEMSVSLISDRILAQYAVQPCTADGRSTRMFRSRVRVCV